MQNDVYQDFRGSFFVNVIVKRNSPVIIGICHGGRCRHVIVHRRRRTRRLEIIACDRIQAKESQTATIVVQRITKKTQRIPGRSTGRARGGYCAVIRRRGGLRTRTSVLKFIQHTRHTLAHFTTREKSYPRDKKKTAKNINYRERCTNTYVMLLLLISIFMMASLYPCVLSIYVDILWKKFADANQRRLIADLDANIILTCCIILKYCKRFSKTH